MDTKDIVAAVRSVVGYDGKIDLHVPLICEPVTTGDPVGYGAIEIFQNELAELLGVDQVLAVSSGTAALHLALIVCGVERFTEVLCPTLTFVGAANAISYCGAIPNFVDSRETDLGINPFKLGRYLDRICETRKEGVFNRMSGRRITALIAVNLCGIPCDIDAIRNEIGRFGIPVIEDGAQSLGSAFKTRPCGSNGFAGLISFNNNKIVTTNGGGLFVTNDPLAQAKAWALATTGRIDHPWRMDYGEIAFNYRMGNINAAFGLSQLRHLNRIIELKARLHSRYQDAGLPILSLEAGSSNKWNHWLNVLMLPELDHRRNEICAALTAEGVACRTLFTPIHDLPMYKHATRDNLEGAQSIWRRAICLPSSPHLGKFTS